MSRCTLTLPDAPPFITNLANLISLAGDILHDIDREKAGAASDDIDRVSSLLSLAHFSCLLTVSAIESGPDYKMEASS
ncbi:hypothetical protein ACSBOB_22030 [Mesorhizobium sp. ASY16-5R]|uniref:hypothetical protein n=1 Tax=Mesorhizobium sp. ASY16-5R TaxID=3445772 RepID=UPI003FA16DD6